MVVDIEKMAHWTFLLAFILNIKFSILKSLSRNTCRSSRNFKPIHFNPVVYRCKVSTSVGLAEGRSLLASL